jgi:hypothetical protein
MSAFSTINTLKDVADDEIASAGEVSTILSHLTLSSKSSAYRGAKGALHKKHANPRIQKAKNLLNEFINLCCDGNEETFEALKLRYTKLDARDSTSKEQATGMLATFCEMGSREHMLRDRRSNHVS